MIIKSSSYINYKNLQNNFTCTRHFKSVQVDNNSDDLSFFSQEMLYFSWNTNSILSH